MGSEEENLKSADVTALISQLPFPNVEIKISTLMIETEKFEIANIQLMSSLEQDNDTSESVRINFS